MGQAKARRQIHCICGSGLVAAECCWTANGWHRLPAPILLSRAGTVGNHPRCYLKDTNSCGDKITKEHYVPQAVLKVLADKEVDVTGLPWLRGKTERHTFSSLTAKCLCDEHNSGLSELDARLGLFFEAIQKCATSISGPDQKFIFSGHDIERAMLKILAGMAFSKHLSLQGKTLPGTFHSTIALETLFDDYAAWKEPMGLYLAHELGTVFQADALFQLQPLLFRGTEDIAGLLTNIQGLQFGLLAIETARQSTALENAIPRPGRLVFRLGDRTNIILLSWEDSLKHRTINIEWKH